MPERDYGLGGREAREAYDSAKGYAESQAAAGRDDPPPTRPRARPDNVAPVGSDDNKSSAPATSVRPRSRPDNVAPVEADSISITNEDTKKVEAYIDSLTGNIVYKDNSRLSKSIKDNVAKNLNSLYPNFSNKTINSLVEKYGPSLIGGLTSEAISMLSPEDRETLAAMQPLGRGINTTPESLRDAFNITPGWKSMPSDISSIIGYLENPEQALETIVDRTSGTFNFGAINPSLRGLTGKIQGDKTISIGYKETFAEGGKVSDEAQLEMELIMNEQVDPVSGNTAPIGAKPEEVRDDVEIRVSPGEYVINAQTVRYFGEDFFDELQKAAAEGFERIKEGEELPFRDDELDIEDDETEEVEPEGFAHGGRVKGYAEGDLVVPQPVGGGYGQYGGTGSVFMGYQSKTFINDETGQKIIIFFFNGRPLSRIPSGFREMGETPAEEQEIAKEEAKEKAVESDKGRDPMDEAERGYNQKAVATWGDDDFNNYSSDARSRDFNPQKVSTGAKVALGLLGTPIGVLDLLARPLAKAQAKSVISRATEDLKNDIDFNGKALTDDGRKARTIALHSAKMIESKITGRDYHENQATVERGETQTRMSEETQGYGYYDPNDPTGETFTGSSLGSGGSDKTSGGGDKTSSSSSGKTSSGGNKDPYSDNNNAQSGGGSSGKTSGGGSSGTSTGQQAADTYSGGDVSGGEFGGTSTGKSAEQEASESIGSYFNKGGLVSRP